MKNITIIALCVVMLGIGMAEVSRTSPTVWAVEPDEPERTETVLQSTARYELTVAERFFALPGVQEDFEKWLKDYERRKAV